MDFVFDPAALQSMDLSMDDDSYVVDLEQVDLLRIVDGQLRHKCAVLRLAGRIVGVAAASSGADISEAVVVETMAVFMRRLAELRQAALTVLNVGRDSTDFTATFNTVTRIMLDVVTDEFKWSKLLGAPSALSSGLVAKLLEQTIRIQPERFDHVFEPTNIVLVRRLAVLSAIPKIYNLVNFFDYYQADFSKVVGRLVRATVEAAEFAAAEMFIVDEAELMESAIFERMYALSVGLMVEIYKSSAAGDVRRLSEMSEFDRSLAVLQYESVGGMPFEHIIERHQDAMRMMMKTANLILESRH